jgi:hypothetical protein
MIMVRSYYCYVLCVLFIITLERLNKISYCMPKKMDKTRKLQQSILILLNLVVLIWLSMNYLLHRIEVV